VGSAGWLRSWGGRRETECLAGLWDVVIVDFMVLGVSRGGGLGSVLRMARDFATAAEQTIEDVLASDPELAQWTGDHRFDDRLPDYSADAVRAQVTRLREGVDVLHEVDPDTLSAEDAVDLQLLSVGIESRLFALTEVREHEWNPLRHNPGGLFHALVARDFAPVEERLSSAIGRLEALPDALATAEATLSDCPHIHVETAIEQIGGTAALIRGPLAELAALVPEAEKEFGAAQGPALEALEAHIGWLRRHLDRPGRDPRLGRRLWEARLWHRLDSELTASAVLERAEAHLAAVSEEIADVAAQVPGAGGVAEALVTLAADHPDNSTIVRMARESLGTVAEFVREADLVSLVDDPCIVIEMPEFARGVAVAYCDPPGALESADVPTFYAIAPTPAGWSPERVTSFYREYNNYMVDNLTVHEAIPGHFLQLAHARRFRGSTRVRAVCASGTFIEGWAVYAEELMVRHGFGGAPVRLQQLKMQLRMTINALLDQLVHCEDLPEADAMALMVGRGYQEHSEAAGKWRRALLTSGQLSTYFVGYTEMSAIARARPVGTSERDWHDAMLAHGSPSPRHLATLLGV
jgi:hypothetical protein